MNPKNILDLDRLKELNNILPLFSLYTPFIIAIAGNLKKNEFGFPAIFFLVIYIAFILFFLIWAYRLIKISNSNGAFNQLKQFNANNKAINNLIFREKFLHKINYKLKDKLSNFNSIDLNLIELNLSNNQNNRLNISNIIQRFEGEKGKILMILGIGGSGKTVTLNQLTEKFVKKAREEERKPLPIILELNDELKGSLEDNLVQKISNEYNISKYISQEGINDQNILLLLDNFKLEFLDKLKKFIKKYNYINIIISISVPNDENDREKIGLKITKYENNRNNFSGYFTCGFNDIIDEIIYIKPLEDEDINILLEQKQLSDLTNTVKQVAQGEEKLQKEEKGRLLQSLVYMRELSNNFDIFNARDLDDKSKRERCLSNYVKSRLEKYPHDEYEEKDINRYLKWLAKFLERKKEKDKIFYLENINLNWDYFKIDIKRTSLVFWSVILFVVFLIKTIILGLIFSFSINVWVDLLNNFLENIIENNNIIKKISINDDLIKDFVENFINFENFRKDNPLVNYIIHPIVKLGVSAGIIVGLISLLIMLFIHKDQGKNIEIKPKKLPFVFKNIVKIFKKKLVKFIMIIFGFFGTIACFLYLFIPLCYSGNQQKIFWACMGFGIFIACVIAISVTIDKTLENEDLPRYQIPNKNTCNAGKNSLIYGLTALLVTLLLYLILLTVLIWLNNNINISINILLTGLLFAIATGIAAAKANHYGKIYFDHLTFRSILTLSNLIPENYKDFLDYAVKLNLLQRVDNGYKFYSPSIQNYFKNVELQKRKIKRGKL
jgi:hypothetical protein